MAPRSMRNGRALVGWGLATATYPTNRMPAQASATILPDGTAVVRCGTQDIGTGTYTIMTQVAAQTLGLSTSAVRAELGDSAMPAAPVSGGSMTTASVTPAVQAACLSAREKLLGLATATRGAPLFGIAPSELTIENGWILLRADATRREPLAAVLARNGGVPVEGFAESKPGEERQKYAMHSFGAVVR